MGRPRRRLQMLFGQDANALGQRFSLGFSQCLNTLFRLANCSEFRQGIDFQGPMVNTGITGS